MCNNSQAYKDDLAQVNRHLENFMNNQDFSDCMPPRKLNWSVLRSDKNLSEPQEAHTHLVSEYSYRLETKVFHFSCIFGIEQHILVNLRMSHPDYPFHIHALIKRGDCLFIRNEIPQRGCENMSSVEHHRLHCHTEPNFLVG